MEQITKKWKIQIVHLWIICYPAIWSWELWLSLNASICPRNLIWSELQDIKALIIKDYFDSTFLIFEKVVIILELIVFLLALDDEIKKNYNINQKWKENRNKT